jgi:hypothetical protein
MAPLYLGSPGRSAAERFRASSLGFDMARCRHDPSRTGHCAHRLGLARCTHCTQTGTRAVRPSHRGDEREARPGHAGRARAHPVGRRGTIHRRRHVRPARARRMGWGLGATTRDRVQRRLRHLRYGGRPARGGGRVCRARDRALWQRRARASPAAREDEREADLATLVDARDHPTGREGVSLGSASSACTTGMSAAIGNCRLKQAFPRRAQSVRCFVHDGHAPVADPPLGQTNAVTRLKLH